MRECVRVRMYACVFIINCRLLRNTCRSVESDKTVWKYFWTSLMAGGEKKENEKMPILSLQSLLLWQNGWQF